mgnify:CR=1 FL=1
MLPFPLQADVTGGGLVAVVVTFFVVAAFYAFTLHLAAVFFIGDVRSQRAAYVSPAPTIVATFVADAIAISYVYRLRWSSAIPLTILHFTFAVVMGIALNGIFGFV